MTFAFSLRDFTAETENEESGGADSTSRPCKNSGVKQALEDGELTAKHLVNTDERSGAGLQETTIRHQRRN